MDFMDSLWAMGKQTGGTGFLSPLYHYHSDMIIVLTSTVAASALIIVFLGFNNRLYPSIGDPITTPYLTLVATKPLAQSDTRYPSTNPESKSAVSASSFPSIPFPKYFFIAIALIANISSRVISALGENVPSPLPIARPSSCADATYL